jgi:hypothetical protein
MLMSVSVLAKGSTAFDPTHNVWIVVGVPVVVALVGAFAAVSVAWASGQTQRRIAEADRSAARQAAERATVETVMEGIADAIADFRNDYETALGIPVGDLEPLPDDWHPSRSALDQALGRLTTRLGHRNLYVACLGWMGSLLDHVPTVEAAEDVAVLQHRLDDWFLGERSLSDTIRLLERDAKEMKTGRRPSSSS